MKPQHMNVSMSVINISLFMFWPIGFHEIFLKNSNIKYVASLEQMYSVSTNKMLVYALADIIKISDAKASWPVSLYFCYC